VIVAVPVCPAAGVSVTVAVRPRPAKNDVRVGHQGLIRRTPLTVKLPAGVSTSPTVKLIGPTAVPELVV